MALQYDLYENPPRPGSNRKPKLHARAVTHGTVNTSQIAEYIQDCCTVTTGDVKAVLSALSDVLVRELSHGRGIHMEGIGYFKLSLSCPAVSTAKEVRANSIRVKTVTFRPDTTLRERFRHIQLVRARQKIHSNPYSEIEIDGLLTGHFLDNTYITSREFQSLCGFTRSTAYRWIKQLLKNGKLQKTGHPRSPLYEPVKGNYRKY